MAIQRLTLAQRAAMADSQTFLRRLVAAIKGTAEYHSTYATDTLAKYNVATKKRKEYSRQVLQSASVANIQAYAEYMLYQYTWDDANGTADLDANGELSDAAISDSYASAATFDFFADVKTGDETKQIEL